MSTAFTADRQADTLVVSYADLGNENGDAFEAYKFPDKTITVYGTGTVTVEGSPEGTNWVALNDQAGAAISLVVAAAAASAVILENPKFMRVVNDNATGVLAVVTCNK